MTDRHDLRIGHALELLRAMPDDSVDSIVTDPPYELGFMDKGWDRSGIAFHVELWAQALRVAKPGAHLMAFSGTRTYHRLACAIEDAGWEVRDQFAWVYGSGMPKSRDLGEGRGTQAKPAWEPIALARKPFKGTIYDNVERNGLGGLNVDACRIAPEGDDLEAYRRNCSGDRGHDRTRARAGTDLSMGGARANDLGRWPANLLHDGSDEVLAHFPDSAGAKGAIRGDEPSCASTGAVTNLRQRVPFDMRDDGAGSAARFFYCGKATPGEREAGLEGLPARNGRRNHHTTVKPIAVGRWLQRLVTPAGGVTLDLFAGSGTFGVSAILEDLRPVLLELDREDGEPAGYEAVIRARLAWAYKERERLREAEAEVQRLAEFKARQIPLIPA
jgi:site-specific DNA-methyltransferase (adenine-specific)